MAVLTPTTLLAEQHYQTFKDRLHLFPLKYVNYQDLEKSENIKSVLDIKNGRVDIVIGTHKLIAGILNSKILDS